VSPSPNQHSDLELQAELSKLLAARRGHFRFESGHHGELWLDRELMFLRPKLVRPFAEHLAERIGTYKIDAVCGPLSGGAFVAEVVASMLDV
jgi:orotate phosphoribosyltransferase